MRRSGILLCLLLLVLSAGCAATQIPTYVNDKKPYARRVYASFDEAQKAVTDALADLGWTVAGTADPSVYEQNSSVGPEAQQLLIFTEVRQTMMGVGTRYARINAVIRADKGISDIEIRFLTVTTIPFKSFRSYRNDSAARRMLDNIEKRLVSQNGG